MQVPFATAERLGMIAAVKDRPGLSRALAALCGAAGGSHFLLIRASDHAIQASNWTFDMIEQARPAVLTANVAATAMGGVPEPLSSMADWNEAARIALAALADHGLRETFCLTLHPGPRRWLLLLSSRKTGEIERRLLGQLQLLCSYLVARLHTHQPPERKPEPLSERERECLAWVAEGKTTEEIALILDVTPNTVNSYLAKAIQRRGSRNRAMAVADAIRTGDI